MLHASFEECVFFLTMEEQDMSCYECYFYHERLRYDNVSGLLKGTIKLCTHMARGFITEDASACHYHIAVDDYRHRRDDHRTASDELENLKRERFELERQILEAEERLSSLSYELSLP